jgi:hypothetical protein
VRSSVPRTCELQMAPRTFHFTLEALGRCEPVEAEYWLRVAAHALTQAGFQMEDAQAIGIDGAGGAALDFPDPRPTLLKPEQDTRRLVDAPGKMR